MHANLITYKHHIPHDLLKCSSVVNIDLLAQAKWCIWPLEHYGLCMHVSMGP